MKKLLLFLSLCSFTTFGQQRVFQRDKFDTEILTIKTAKVKYPTAANSRTIERTNNVKRFEVDEKRINNDFMRKARLWQI